VGGNAALKFADEVSKVCSWLVAGTHELRKAWPSWIDARRQYILPVLSLLIPFLTFRDIFAKYYKAVVHTNTFDRKDMVVKSEAV